MSVVNSRTANELTKEEWRQFQPDKLFNIQQSSNREALRLRRRRALHLAHKAADILKKSYGAQKVVIFGSFTQKGAFSLWSDVDLAAWGIDPVRFYEAVAVITGLSAEFKVDLVDTNSCRPALKNVILQSGFEL